jgi:hypothetical protein
LIIGEPNNTISDPFMEPYSNLILRHITSNKRPKKE